MFHNIHHRIFIVLILSLESFPEILEQYSKNLTDLEWKKEYSAHPIKPMICNLMKA